MFSLPQLLNPISVAQWCGEDLSFSADLDVIAKARLHDDPTLEQGAWVVALKEADWPFVAARCAHLLESKSKDLRLAVWLAEAQAKTRHFRGLGDGYALLSGLCEQFWDGLYPAADDGDVEQRTGNLFWLLARSPQLLREIPLTEDAGDGAWGMLDFDAARQRGVSAASATGSNSWGATVVADGPALAVLEAARRASSPAFSAALLADAEYCLAMLLQLEKVADVRFGADGPGFSAARDALHGVLHFLRPAGQAAGAHGASAVLHNRLPAGASAAAGGVIDSRAEALQQLRAVAEFFRRTEPHSPVSYLADKAASWGELPLHLWLRAVVRDGGALAQLDELLGAPHADGAG
jgi:type VI secretion system protein ImpA